MLESRSVVARGIVGLFPANRVGDDVEIYADEERRRVTTIFRFLRQQRPQGAGKPHLSLADYVAPRESGVVDWVGAFAVGVFGAGELALCFAREHDDYRAILVKALADRLAEAFAERLHERVRKEFWCYAPDEELSDEDLVRCEYRGIRPAPGYPACPDHTEKPVLWELLDVEARTGIRLTETHAMDPPASVSGLYFAHPEARYFGIGPVGRDQVEDYAARKGMKVEEVERWLASNLGY